MTADGDACAMFMVVSNARSGSTWLETSLGRLSDVTADYEFAWQPSFAPKAVHILMEGAEFTCVGALARIAAENPSVPVVGSKFVVDAFRLYDHSNENYLLERFSPDISIIHLTRDYFDSLLSAEARGFVHLLATGGEGPSEGGRIGAVLEVESPIGAAPKFVDKPVSELVGKLLILFLNDLLCMKIAHNARRSTHVDYAHINESFPDLARFVGSTAPGDAVNAVVTGPLTGKLETLEPSLLPSWEALKKVADHLDSAKRGLMEGRLSVKEVCALPTAEVYVAGLAEAVAGATGREDSLGRILARVVKTSAAPRLSTRLFRRKFRRSMARRANALRRAFGAEPLPLP